MEYGSHASLFSGCCRLLLLLPTETKATKASCSFSSSEPCSPASPAPLSCQPSMCVVCMCVCVCVVLLLLFTQLVAQECTINSLISSTSP